MIRLPPMDRSALLLDLDGTLLDIAPTPDSVVVPPGLLASLRALEKLLDGAMAVISGRPVAQLDALLDAIPFAASGEHGGALRFGPGAELERGALPEPPAEWLSAVETLARHNPGTLLERKARGFVLHYRAVPALGPALQAALEAMIAGCAGFTLMRARKAWEVRPAGADKGTAVATLMARVPFAGRLPIFIGDDVTDADGMAAAKTLGGAGFLVKPAFGDPQGVRDWLAASASAGEWSKLDRWRV